ncbi:MAG TPA: AAA family ATPase [Syntrophales bacterium]|jgi:general secretion pathway protein A|nr:AAA family ATPase [Syntrophales bacterium]
MYEKFFRLREKPFEITPDPRFIYLSDSHKEALAYLTYAVNEGKGFTVITGEVGTGKTTLIRMAISRLDGQVRTAYVFNPRLNTEDLLQYICDDLGIKTRPNLTKGQLIYLLHHFLLDCYRKNERVVLVIDEAQALNPELLEEVRLLTNLETSTSKLLQVVLVGQPELDKTLSDPKFRQLKQRISVRYHIKPLSLVETEEYILKRLRTAGARHEVIFDPAAVREIHEHSGGIPRLINVICDNALLTAYSYERKLVGKAIIKEVVRDMEGGQRRKSRKTLFFITVIVLVIFGLLSYLFDPGFLDSWTDRIERAVATGGLYKQKVQRAY